MTTLRHEVIESIRCLLYTSRERNDRYGIYEEVIAEMGFPVLSTRLPDSKKCRRDRSEERKSVFRSTICPMDTALLKGSGIREFSEEISDIIRQPVSYTHLVKSVMTGIFL